MQDLFSARKKQAKLRSEELAKVNRKINEWEERLMNDEIEGQTYKKWFKKYFIEKSKLESDIKQLGQESDFQLNRVQRLLPHLVDIPNLFRNANIAQKHALIRRVFKHGFTYKEGSFRTLFLNPAFAHNELILKEKGLLFVEQPSINLPDFTGCSGIGS
jgi:site-specific DNA recombinase